MSNLIATCSIPSIFENPFQTDTFNNTASITFWHLRAARYGNTNEIIYLIDGTESQAEEYLRGLLASSITIFAIAVVWCCFLLAFKCIGPYGIGWLSGQHIPVKAKPVPEDCTNQEEFEKRSNTWENMYKRIMRGRKIMKCCVVFAGLSIVACAIMLSVKGVDTLIQTLDSADQVIDTAIVLMEEGVTMIDNVIASQDQLVNNTRATWDAINGMCPTVRDPICTDITDTSTCNFTEIIESSEGLMEFLGFIADTRTLVFQELNKSRADLLESIAFANSISDLSDTFSWAFWCSLAFSLATALACLFFVYRAIWPPSQSSFCSCRNVFFIPAFTLLVVLSWTFSIVFVIGSVGLADMCYDSPDENFKALLQQFEGIFSPLIYKSIIFYVSGCPVDLVAPEIVEFLQFLVIVFDSIQGAMKDLNGQLISGVCGTQAIAGAVDATELVNESICGAADLLNDLHVYLQCENWYPLYDMAVYQTMCYQGTEGFTWVTSTQIAIVICSMIILSMRVIFHDLIIDEPISKVIGGVGDDTVGSDKRSNEEQALSAIATLPKNDDEEQFKDDMPESDMDEQGNHDNIDVVEDSIALDTNEEFGIDSRKEASNEKGEENDDDDDLVVVSNDAEIFEDEREGADSHLLSTKRDP